MARIDSDAQGAILKLVRGYGDETHPGLGAPAPGRVHVRRFDELTNAPFFVAYDANPQAFRLVGQTVTQEVAGQQVEYELSPDGPAYAALADATAMLSKIKDTNDPFTREEIARFGALAFRANGVSV